MQKQTSHLLRLVVVILGLTFLASLVVLVIGMVFQWSTPVQFSNGFFGAGLIVIVLGTFSVTGGLHQRSNPSLAYAETASHASIAERGQRMMADINQRYSSMVLMIGTGLLLVGIGILIPQLF
jgi:uncharacterized membrane protein